MGFFSDIKENNDQHNRERSSQSLSQLPIKKWGSGDSTFDRKVRLLS